MPDGGTTEVKEFLRGAVAKVGPILLTGAGFLGFVAVVGGVVVWFRFYTAQLPSVQAIDAMPRSEMLVNGAVPLILFGVVGVVAVGVCYAFDHRGKATLKMARSLIVIFGGVVALAVMIAPVKLQSEDWVHEVLSVADWPDAFPREARFWVILLIVASALGAVLALPFINPDADSENSELFHADVDKFLGLLGGFVVVCLLAWAISGELWVGVAMLLAGALALLNFRLAGATESDFTTFGVVLFFSIPLFAGIATFLVVASDPLVQPAALVRSDREGRLVIEGLYIAASDSHVYLGSVATDGCGSSSLRRGSGSIFRIPRDEVVAMRVGRVQPVKDAIRNAPALTRLLVRNAGAFPDRKSQRTTTADAETSQNQQTSQMKPRETKDQPPPAWPLRHTRDRAIREEPTVTRVSPPNQTKGDQVTVYGDRFGEREGRVLIGARSAQIVSWGDDEIEVIVPSAARKTSRVSVQCPGDDVLLNVPR